MYEACAGIRERELFIRAMGRTLSLKASQLLGLLRASPKAVTEIGTSLYSTIDDQTEKMVFYDFIKNKEMAREFRRQARTRIDFVAENATRHYVLDMSLLMDRSVVEMLYVVNSYEARKARS